MKGIIFTEFLEFKAARKFITDGGGGGAATETEPILLLLLLKLLEPLDPNFFTFILATGESEAEFSRLIVESICFILLGRL